MKVYDRPYKIFSAGSYVVIKDDQVEIVDSRYSSDVLVELYYHDLVIIKDLMKVILEGPEGQVLSVIHHAKRIVDMRTDEHE